MLKVSIIKNGQMTHGAQFETQGELDAWLAKHETQGSFGVKQHIEFTQVEIFPAVFDELGNEISPAQFETQENLIEGYTIEIVDLTAQLAQEAINKEALEYLNSTDWLIIRQVDENIPCPEDIKQARAEARARIVR